MAPSDRSSTVRWPPLYSRVAPSRVISADQPGSVPPATSMRSISSGTATAYQVSCLSYCSFLAAHSR